MEIPLQIEDLTKIYVLGKNKKKKAVDSLNIKIPEGIIFGFLGPNGAGKTTTIKMILDFIHPTAGSVSVLGIPSTEAKVRKSIGYLPEQPYFQKFLKPSEVVAFHAGLAGMRTPDIGKETKRALERAGIAEYTDVPISKLSKGLTQRVGIAAAIVGNPKLLILDEPASGLDPIGRRQTRDLLEQLRHEGKTIFLSSHILGEIEDLCDMVGILRQGSLVAFGKPTDITRSDSSVIFETAALTDDAVKKLQGLKADVDNGELLAHIHAGMDEVYPLVSALHEMNLPILNIHSQRETLEQAFLRLVA